MARIRTVKPEFWTSEQVAECSTITRLLFIGMWNFCDDGGNHPASLKSLKMQIFPSDDIQVSEIESMVKELINHGLIAQYTVNNKDYWHVLGWHHQKIDKPNYKHPEYFPTNSKPIDDHSSNDSLPVDPVRESKGMEGKGMDINNKNNASEDFQKQDESHLYVSHTRRNYCLFVGWKPEPDTWAIKLKASSYRVKPEQFTDYIIAEFVRKNIGEEEKTEHKWQDYLIEAVIRGYIKPEGQEAKPTNQPKTYQQRQDEEYDNNPSFIPFEWNPSMGTRVSELGKITEEEKERRKKISAAAIAAAGVKIHGK